MTYLDTAKQSLANACKQLDKQKNVTATDFMENAFTCALISIAESLEKITQEGIVMEEPQH